MCLMYFAKSRISAIVGQNTNASSVLAILDCDMFFSVFFNLNFKRMVTRNKNKLCFDWMNCQLNEFEHSTVANCSYTKLRTVKVTDVHKLDRSVYVIVYRCVCVCKKLYLH